MSSRTLFVRASDLRPLALALGLAAQLGGCDADSAATPSEEAGAEPDAQSDAAEPDGGEEAMFVGCPETLPAFALGMQALGKAGHLRATLIEASPAPPQRYINDWVIELGDPEGTPLDDARIVSARPWMAVHGHDGNLAPVLRALDEPGRFAVDKLNLFMRGPWEIQLKLSSPSAGDDDVVFEVCIPE